MSEYIIGVDDVGSGPWAGPLVVCAVRAPIDWTMAGLKDSKQLSDKKLEQLSALLLADKAIQHVFIEKSNDVIDEKGLGQASKEAYVEAMLALYQPGDKGIIDGDIKLSSLPPNVSCMVKADQQLPSVMAAAIIAKVYRDGLMTKLDEQFPMYNWKSNVGYGTKDHKEGIKKYGLSIHHRKSFKIKL
ncbi:MAG TPA: ribonuclease HII [Anaerovoracaceae bacterium]|nr:ribonuclease HII [Anaerovoracaceae bacterium]